jgi:5-methylcytosine-specific restriction endonuclease McrA
MRDSVLVLNQNYEPLNICSVRRALKLVLGGKAELLESARGVITSATRIFPFPSVIRLFHLIKRPRPRVKLTRKEIFIRDGYTCQYCGVRTSHLTIDHVIPRSRGGLHTWDNVVAACQPCNHRKGGKSIAEARMALMHQPHEPRASQYYTVERRLETAPDEVWSKFLPGLALPTSSGSST